MFAVELEFSGDPARLELRPEHRSQLADAARAGKVRLAGPWADESGALLVFDVPDEAAVREILGDDPVLPRDRRHRPPDRRVERHRRLTRTSG